MTSYMEIVLWGLGILVAVVFGVLGLRKQRPSLSAGGRVISLEIQGARHSRLTVNWDDSALQRPRQLDVRISNTGSADLQSKHFDQGRPITATLKSCTVVGVLSADAGWDIDEAGGVLTFGPELLKRREGSTVSLIVDGASPRIAWDQKLADVSWNAHSEPVPTDQGAAFPGLTLSELARFPPSTASMQQSRSLSGRLSSPWAAMAGLAVVLVVVVGAAFALGGNVERPVVPEECKPYINNEALVSITGAS